MAIDMEREAKRQEFARFEERFLQLNGVEATSRFVRLAEPPIQVHLLEAGQGEPAVLLHGGDGEGADWAPLLSRFDDRLHLFALDRPGFGLSDPFDYRSVDLRRHAETVVASLLDVLELETATLIGGSMGGFFALAAALAHPGRVRRLALVGYPVGMTREAPLPLRISCAVPGATKMMMRQAASKKGQHNQYRKMFHVDPDKISDEYFDLRVAALQMGTGDTWALLLRRIAGLRGIRRGVYLGDELHKISQPTLVMFGEHDMATVDAGRTATARIPGARFVALPGVAHFPFLEAPEESARVLRGFLDET
jgi:pimeloyl-ACP methyl ester carboxylesterase